MSRACLALVLAGACQGPTAPGVAAQATTGGPDAGARDGGPSLSWVDIAVTGCPRYEPSVPGCVGAAPLELRFTAVSPVAPQSQVWSFGDGSPTVSSAAPVHRFTRTGGYAVTVTVGGPGGTIQAKREMYVTVTAGGMGADCTSGGCAAGLTCVCGAGCPGFVGPGFCAERCDESSRCAAGSVCIDPGPRGVEDGWPAQACVRSCASDAECTTGWSCLDLPGPNGSWTRGCFPPIPLGDEGAACRDATGTADDARCLSHGCSRLGARGLCAAECDILHPCPPYAECAQFNDGTRRCLVRCTADRPCDGDPFLACEASNSAGVLGFTIPDRAVKLCAPRRCSEDSICGPEGTCVRIGSANFCVKKSN